MRSFKSFLSFKMSIVLLTHDTSTADLTMAIILSSIKPLLFIFILDSTSNSESNPTYTDLATDKFFNKVVQSTFNDKLHFEFL